MTTDEWLNLYPGQYAVIKHNELLGTFSAFEQAFEAGVARYGNRPFLIKQILRKEPVTIFPALTAGLHHARM